MNRDKSNYNNMIYKKLSLSILLFAAGFLTASAQKSPQDMDRFIDVLMNKMTLEEKIGQLNLPVTGKFTAGYSVIVRDGRYSRIRNDVPYPARFVLHLGHDSH